MARQPTPEELAFADAQKDDAEEREYHKRVSGAIDDTDREVFDFGSAKSDDEVKPEDENDHDHSLENTDEDIAGGDPEDEEEPQQDDEQDEEEGEDEGEQPEAEPQAQDERQERYVPSYRLREEREARERLERELAETRARMQMPPQQQAPPQPPPEPPDMFVDPKGWEQAKKSEWLQEAEQRYVHRSLAAAAEEHGEDFTYLARTLEGAIRQGDANAVRIYQQIIGSPDPGRAMMRWGDGLLQQKADQEQENHRQWIAENYGEEALAVLDRQNMRQSPRQGQGRSPATPSRRGMPSLNSAGSSGGPRSRLDPRGMDGSEEAIFNDVFAPPSR